MSRTRRTSRHAGSGTARADDPGGQRRSAPAAWSRDAGVARAHARRSDNSPADALRSCGWPLKERGSREACTILSGTRLRRTSGGRITSIATNGHWHVIEIAELTPDLQPAYVEFIASHPATMIYSTLPYREFLQRTAGGTPRYLVALEGRRIVGTLPLFVLHDATWGDAINSLPWYGSYGGCVVRSDDHEAIRARLLTASRAILSAPSVSYATVILSPDEQQHVQQYMAMIEPDATDRRVGQITRLPEDGADLEARLAQACRQKQRVISSTRRSNRVSTSGSRTTTGRGGFFTTRTRRTCRRSAAGPSPGATLRRCES